MLCAKGFQSNPCGRTNIHLAKPALFRLCSISRKVMFLESGVSLQQSRGLPIQVSSYQGISKSYLFQMYSVIHNSTQILPMPRDELRKILHDHFDDEFMGRFVGKKRVQLPRTPLMALGSWHQEHSDGHEKMAEQGLNMGRGIHLPMYASKDQYSAFLHALILMPNVRNANAICHYYLDLVEGRGCKITYLFTLLLFAN